MGQWRGPLGPPVHRPQGVRGLSRDLELGRHAVDETDLRTVEGADHPERGTAVVRPQREVERPKIEVDCALDPQVDAVDLEGVPGPP